MNMYNISQTLFNQNAPLVFLLLWHMSGFRRAGIGLAGWPASVRPAVTRRVRRHGAIRDAQRQNNEYLLRLNKKMIYAWIMMYSYD